MTLSGCDISHWQKGLDLAHSGLDFAIMKATESTDFLDHECDRFYQAAKGAGIKRGVYHFWNAGSATAQADWFVKNIQGYIGDAILVLDWESGNTGDVAAAKAWLDRVYDKTGVRPLIYMSGSVVNGHNWSSVVNADYGLWVARWGSSSPGATGAWPGAAIWQYTDAGTVPHYTGRVDLDYFYGNEAAWDAYAGGGGTPPTPNPPPSYFDLDTDGKWGGSTTGALQESEDTPVDREISSQDQYWRSSVPGITQGIEWVASGTAKGSQIITAMQTDMKAKGQYDGDLDGLIGPKFINALSSRYGIKGDSRLDLPSITIEAMQERLNETGHF